MTRSRSTLLRSLVLSSVTLFATYAPVFAEEIVREGHEEVSGILDDTTLGVPILYNDFKLLRSEDTVYTVSKRIEALRTAPTAVSVITSNHLPSLGGRYIPQILRLFPGIDVLQITRTEFTVSTRGFANRSNFRPRDVLVLVDGRTVYDDFSGSVEWETLDIFPQDVGKIEVIRGAGSAIYGANAARGVINIITKPPQATPVFESETSLADLHGFRQRIAAARSTGPLAWRISGGFDQADTWDTIPDISLANDKSVKTWHFNTMISRELAGGAELRMGGGTNTGELLQTTTSGFPARNDQSTNYVRLEYEHPYGYVRTFWNYRHLESVDPETGEFLSERTQHLYDVEGVHRIIRLGRSNLSWGGGLRFTTVDADSVGGQESLFTSGVFLDEQYNVTDHLLARLAGRLDYHEEVGYHFSPRAGIAYQINPRHTVKTSVNVGYRNPTLADNYFDFSILDDPTDPSSAILIKGNRDLKPEESVWYEAGYLGQFIPGLTLGLDLFYVVTDNFIRSTFIPPDTFTYVNAEETVRGEGGELWSEYELTDSLRLIANYSYVKYEEDSEDIESTPPNKVNLGLLFSNLKRFTGALTLHYRDHAKWPFVGGPDVPSEQDAYVILNLNLGYQWTNNLSVRFEAYNITNNKHRELPVIGEEIPIDVAFHLSYNR